MYKINQTDLSKSVHQTLKDMILSNQLVSGQKLNQKKLSEMLGVSRTPLLAAFSKLEKEMLVELLPRRGAFVKKLSRKDFENLYDIRLRLEPLGAALAAEWCKPDEIKELQRLLSIFERKVLETQLDTIRSVDYHFHMAIMKMSQNDMLYRMISSFNLIIISNLKGLLKDPKLSLNEHRELSEAINSHDAGKAEKAMYRHIMGAKKNIDKLKF